MSKSKDEKIADLLSKISKDQFYHEYIELNEDRKYLISKYQLNSFEWKYLTKECDIIKPYALSRAKSGKRGGITRSNKNTGCRAFIQEHFHEIQTMMSQGKSMLEIFNYYQEIETLSWHDYPTFGAYIRKTGLKYSKEALDKVAQTRTKHFVETMINRSPEAKRETYQKYKQSMNSKSADELRAIRLKIEKTKSQYSKERRELVQSRANFTKAQNNSFNSSKPEEFIKEFLTNIHSAVSQYRESRYPFNCDFYIPEFDLFIEINSFWVHGRHPFSESNPDDMERLAWIRSKQNYIKSKNGFMRKNSYYVAEDVWIRRDPLKLKTAQDNRLNYLAIYNLNANNMYDITMWNFKRFTGINIVDMNNSSYLNTEI